MSRRKAFTLVELLVAIGIITVLIAILLPAVVKAKRQAERIACASNMRQVGQGLLAYAYGNKDYFPAPGDIVAPREEDWLHWQSSRNLEESRIWPYIGRSDRVLRCPSGATPRFEYAYSYALGVSFAGRPENRPGRWKQLPCRLSSAYRPTSKVLLGEPDENGIFDSAWFPSTEGRAKPQTPGLQWHWLSVRHEVSDSRKRHLGDETGRGNVIFADGHWEFIPRWMTLMPALYDPRAKQELRTP